MNDAITTGRTMHNIKLQLEFADDVYSGVKTFEIRKNDRNYMAGDLVKFECVDACGYSYEHPINNKIYGIVYFLSG